MGGQRLGFRVIRASQEHVLPLYDLLAWRRADDGLDGPPPRPKGARLERTLDRMRRHLGSDSLWVWVARSPGQTGLTGYVSIARILKPDGRITFYVDELWVPRPFRRQGIATHLMQEVIRTAEEMQVWSIRLTAADTQAARSLYRNLGFEVRPSGWAEMRLR